MKAKRLIVTRPLKQEEFFDDCEFEFINGGILKIRVAPNKIIYFKDFISSIVLTEETDKKEKKPLIE